MSASTREAVLGRIRRSNGARPNDPERRRIVEERMAGAPVGIVPRRGQLPHDEQVALFISMAERANATTARPREAGPGT